MNDLQILQTAAAMARHAAKRQELIAGNIANADTPGYKARDIESFSEAYQRSRASQRSDNTTAEFRVNTIEQSGTASPNGNTVSLEDQMWRGMGAARQHETAVTIYSKTLSLLRATLGGGR